MIRQPQTSFYNQPHVKGLAAFNPEGNAVARCILWTMDDGRQCLDRVYYSDSAGRRALMKWARENGILTDPPQDGRVTMPINSDGYPYMDNFNVVLRQDNSVVLFTDYDQRDKYAAALPDGVYQEEGTFSSTSGGKLEWRTLLVPHNGKLVNAAHIVTNPRTRQVVVISDLPQLDVDHLTTSPPTQAFRDPYGSMRMVFADQFYIHNGNLYQKDDTDVFLNGTRTPANRVIAEVIPNPDGGWTHTLHDYDEWERRSRVSNGNRRLVRFYLNSTYRADVYMTYLMRRGQPFYGTGHLNRVITVENMRLFEDDARRHEAVS